MVDAARLPQSVVLLELGTHGGIVDGVGPAAALLDDGEARDVARAVGDVDHVLERDAAILRGDLGVDVDRGVAVRALVDLEDGTGLGGVVDHDADLGDLGGGIEGHLLLLEETGAEGVLDEFAGPDGVDVRGKGAAANHLGEARADDVVLELDLMLGVFGLGFHPGTRRGEESRQAGVEADLLAALAEDLVVKAGHLARDHVGEQVVEVADLGRDIVPALAVVLREGVGLSPEGGLVDTVPTEKRRLHVGRDQSLVKIPDAGDDVLSEERRGHRGYILLDGEYAVQLGR